LVAVVAQAVVVAVQHQVHRERVALERLDKVAMVEQVVEILMALIMVLAVAAVEQVELGKVAYQQILMVV
jgi:hypothetical protein